MPTVTPKEWSAFYANQPNAHILQCGRWGELKRQFGWEVVRFVHGKAGAQVLIRQLPLRQSMAYIPMGPIGKDWSCLMNDIDDFCVQNRISFLKIEPDQNVDQRESFLNIPGIVVSTHTIQPSRSIEVDLKGDNESLLARMKQKTRYNIGLSSKKGVIIRSWNDLEGFHKMMQATGERDVFGVHSLSYYQKVYELFHPDKTCELLAAFIEGEVLAAIMVFSAGERAWYFYGASNNQNRHLMSTYLLQWEAMLWAKRKGCTHYDLWGVPNYDEDYLENNFSERHDGLWGVYRFKRGFGGTVIKTMGAYDRVYRKLIYSFYRTYVQVFKQVD